MSMYRCRPSDIIIIALGADPLASASRESVAGPAEASRASIEPRRSALTRSARRGYKFASRGALRMLECRLEPLELLTTCLLYTSPSPRDRG